MVNQWSSDSNQSNNNILSVRAESEVKWSLVPQSSSWSVYSIIIDELLSGVIEWRAVQCLICTGQLVQLFSTVLYAINLLLIWFKEIKKCKFLTIIY